MCDLTHERSTESSKSDPYYTFKQGVISFKDKLDELVSLALTVDLVSTKHAHECVRLVQTNTMPLGNSLMFEAGLCVPKIDVVTDELSILISALISKYPFQRKTDIFQLVSTIVVAVDNNIRMEDIRIMLQMHPPHLVDVTDHSKVGMGS